MTATKVKPNEVIGDHLPILTWQVNRIMQNCSYQVDTKNEWVQWVTGDVNRTSLKSITQAQAKKIMITQQGGSYVNEPSTENWGAFNLKNPKHVLIMSLVRQRQWVKPHPKHGEVADMSGAFANWLKSKLSPVQKPLMDMTPIETEKIIKALGGVVGSKY